MPPKVLPLTGVEKAWIAEQLRRAEDFVRRYADAAQVTIETLDMAWERWIASGESDPDTIQGIVNAVGIAFGHALTIVTPLQWVTAADSETSELALFAFPGSGDLLIFPTHIVGKRREKNETRFLAPTYTAITAQVDRIGQLQPRAPAEVPLWKRLLMGPGSR
jgi:hypothetical protein